MQVIPFWRSTVIPLISILLFLGYSYLNCNEVCIWDRIDWDSRRRNDGITSNRQYSVPAKFQRRNLGAQDDIICDLDNGHNKLLIMSKTWSTSTRQCMWEFVIYIISTHIEIILPMSIYLSNYCYIYIICLIWRVDNW